MAYVVVSLAALSAACGLDMTGAQDVPPLGTAGASLPLDGGSTTTGAADPATPGSVDGGDPGDPGASDGGASAEPLPSARDAGASSTACAPALACPAGVRDVGVVVGDQGAQSVKATGAASALLRVRVTETQIASVDIRAKLTLTSPPGANYDLYVYYDEADSAPTHTECAKLRASSTSTDATDTVAVTWNDLQPLGGHEDSTNVTVEVRFVSGVCVPGAEWTLVVQGNAR